MSDERYLRDMTVKDWRERVANLRSMLIEAERQLERAQQLAIKNIPLAQEAARRPVR